MNAKEIRAFLRWEENQEGRTAAEIAKEVRSSGNAVTKTLNTMVDAYIDRYVKDGRHWIAVWTVVEVPENCPMPERRPTA